MRLESVIRRHIRLRAHTHYGIIEFSTITSMPPSSPQFITNSISLSYFHVQKHRKFYTYKYVTNLHTSHTHTHTHYIQRARERRKEEEEVWLLFLVCKCMSFSNNKTYATNQPTCTWTNEMKRKNIKFPPYQYCCCCSWMMVFVAQRKKMNNIRCISKP